MAIWRNQTAARALTLKNFKKGEPGSRHLVLGAWRAWPDLWQFSELRDWRGLSITPRQQPKKARRKIPEMGGARRSGGRVVGKLQALVYDILRPTTAIVDYAIGLGKLTSNFSLMLKRQ